MGAWWFLLVNGVVSVDVGKTTIPFPAAKNLHTALAMVMALLMMLAFGIDQVQQKSNALFRAAWAKKGPKCALWEAVRQLLTSFEVSSMREIYEAMAFGYERPRLKPQRGPALPGGKVADTS